MCTAKHTPASAAQQERLRRGREAPKSPEHRAKIAASNRATKRARGQKPIERFCQKWHRDFDTGCFGWTASLDADGYALFSVDGKTVRAFRWIYQHVFGTIPDHLVPDHTCRNRACVNPFHAEIVTNKVNVLRGVSFAAQNAVATHCKRGHEFTAENTYRHQGGRQCRACRRVAALAAYHRAKGRVA